MGRLRRLLRLPTTEKWLLLKAWLLVAGIRLALLTLRYRLSQGLLRRLAAKPPPRLVRSRPKAVHLAWAVTRAARLVPGGQQCLTMAMATEFLLHRRGYSGQLHIGVARNETNELIAHAWLECGGVVLVGGDHLDSYTELTPPERSSDQAP